jgi:hypothetical protein
MKTGRRDINIFLFANKKIFILHCGINSGFVKKSGPVLSPDSIASWHNQACDYV